MRYAPHGRAINQAEIIKQEVAHGQIVSDLLEGLGDPNIERPIKQYAFHIPLED